MSTASALVWFRRDLRVSDHPALDAAARAAEQVVGLFVLDDALLAGRYRSTNRTAFMLACVAELREALRARGGELLVRRGEAVTVVPEVAAAVGAAEVLWTSDVGPYARRRDRAVTAALRERGIRPRPQPGTYVADPSRPRTAGGAPHTVFSPFLRQWERQERRPVVPAPASIGRAPAGLDAGALPRMVDPLPEPVAVPGEVAARAALERVLAATAGAYAERRDLVAGGSSELSPHLRWGTISAREVEERLLALGAGAGPAALRRQLAWRDFNAHVLLMHPDCLRDGLHPRARRLEPDTDPRRLAAWQEGRTGYPLVDAGMRQLQRQGWMHNRARMVTGSFLTQDLHLDWQAGEEHFARLLYDGEPAQNSLNWKWVASVGADPAPYARVFNPVTQAQKFDPDGAYVRRWVPELARLPTELLWEPWTLSSAAQDAYGCVVGRDYPLALVDHAAERKVAIARFAAAS